jgi:hypothetical protein
MFGMKKYMDIVIETGDAELALFPESHRFQVPDFSVRKNNKTAITPPFNFDVHFS